MTDLYSGQLTDLLQNDSAHNAEIQALAYAVRLEKQRIMEEADKTRTLAMIQQLPEAILDVLAVELRTPYYTEDMTIQQKRDIIQNTLVWFYHAGTPAAVAEMIAAIFGQGEVVEWFNFTEEPATPGTFDIITDTRMTEDIVARFLQIVSRVKNTRSHLRRVLVERHGYQDEFIGTGTITAPETNVLNSPARERAAGGPSYTGSALAVESKTNILNSPPPGTASVRQTQAIFSAAVANSQITIP